MVTNKSFLEIIMRSPEKTWNCFQGLDKPAATLKHRLTAANIKILFSLTGCQCGNAADRTENKGQRAISCYFPGTTKPHIEVPNAGSVQVAETDAVTALATDSAPRAAAVVAPGTATLHLEISVIIITMKSRASSGNTP